MLITRGPGFKPRLHSKGPPWARHLCGAGLRAGAWRHVGTSWPGLPSLSGFEHLPGPTWLYPKDRDVLGPHWPGVQRPSFPNSEEQRGQRSGTGVSAVGTPSGVVCWPNGSRPRPPVCPGPGSQACPEYHCELAVGAPTDRPTRPGQTQPPTWPSRNWGVTPASQGAWCGYRKRSGAGGLSCRPQGGICPGVLGVGRKGVLVWALSYPPGPRPLS